MNNDIFLWLVCALIFFLIMLIPVPAKSHSWYDQDCCHDKDCSPIISVKPSSDPNQSLIVTKHGSGVTSLTTKRRKSQDDQDHACIVYEHVICLYEATKY